MLTVLWSDFKQSHQFIVNPLNTVLDSDLCCLLHLQNRQHCFTGLFIVLEIDGLIKTLASEYQYQRCCILHGVMCGENH